MVFISTIGHIYLTFYESCLYNNISIIIVVPKLTPTYVRQIVLIFDNAEYFCINHGDQRFMQFLIIINILVSSFWLISVSVSVCYVAVRTIVLSRHGCYRTTLWIFWGLAGWKLRLRPLRFFKSNSSSVRRAIWFTWFPEPHDTTSLHACPSVYNTWYWQSQAVTHPIMSRSRRCLTSVIEPTPDELTPYTVCIYTFDGSTTIINILFLSARGPSLWVRICRLG